MIELEKFENCLMSVWMTVWNGVSWGDQNQVKAHSNSMETDQEEVNLIE